MSREVFLHAGFHKTGTTSLQNALLTTLDENVYPRITKNGPGHAELAQRCLLSSHPEYDENALLAVLDNWSAGESEKLVISSEDFSKAMFDHDAEGSTWVANGLLKAVENYPINLILSRAPVTRTALATSQEMIKHGSVLRHLSSAMMQEVLKRPQFSVESIDGFLSLPWQSMTFISSEKDDPNFLITEFGRLIDYELSLETKKLNERWAGRAIQAMSILNATVPKIPIHVRRRIALSSYALWVRPAQSRVSKKVWEGLNTLENDITDWLGKLEEQGRINWVKRA